MSDMAGKAAREVVEPSGSERDTMLLGAGSATNLRQGYGEAGIDGQTREGERAGSERFNCARA